MQLLEESFSDEIYSPLLFLTYCQITRSAYNTPPLCHQTRGLCAL